MAINPVIPRGLLNDPCNIQPVKQFTSYEPVHLFLQYTTEEPTLIPRRKRYRGTDFECGYTVKWPMLQCVEQKEPGNTITHTFPLPTLPPDSCIWYRLSTSCVATNPISFSPPIKYCYPPCQTTGTYIKIQRETNTARGSNIICPMIIFVAGDINMWNQAGGQINLTQIGTWQGYSYGRIRCELGSAITPTVFRVSIDRGSTPFPGATVDISLLNNQELDFVVNYTYTKTTTINDSIRTFLTRISGPSALARFIATPTSPCVLTAIKS